MVETLVLKAEKRKRSGTRDARQLRKQGLIPAIVYGHKQEPVAIQLNYHDLAMEMQHHHRLLKVKLDDKVEQLLLKDIQYDHLGDKFVHVDLTRVDMDERVTVTVAVELRGTAAGTHEGGVLEHMATELEVECPVVSIPEQIRAMVAELQIGEVLKAGDIELPAGITLISDPETPVATVRLMAEEPEAEEAEAGSDEPEVIERGREEEAEE